MMKNIIKNKTAMAVLVGSCIVALSYITQASTFNPGTNEDPLVTRSYVDTKISQINTSGINIVNTMQVITLNKGEKLILEAGSQMILRNGTARIIDSPSGGISNLTTGVDMIKDSNIPRNNLLLAPRSDGRGARAITDCIFTVTGNYRIEK
ncbi:hypothetical protein [Alkalithermobacter paradoxus]|uniref:LPS-assembly protein LptD n=1 Tax=Alkalithermobacter paradoxus TaxID=29349 RepID=A0A1V4I5U6_9FIRM|nr:hypothetical protein CLOTH_15520 [[Clostridium] thermoalcaliphilum]